MKLPVKQKLFLLAEKTIQSRSVVPAVQDQRDKILWLGVRPQECLCRQMCAPNDAVCRRSCPC